MYIDNRFLNFQEGLFYNFFYNYPTGSSVDYKNAPTALASSKAVCRCGYDAIPVVYGEGNASCLSIPTLEVPKTIDLRGEILEVNPGGLG